MFWIVSAFLLFLTFYGPRIVRFLQEHLRRKRLTAPYEADDRYPIVGHMFHRDRRSEGIARDAVLRANEARARGKEVTAAWMLHEAFVVPLTGRALKSILDSQTEIVKGSQYDAILAWLGNGLLLSSGDVWKRKRRLLTPTFHFAMLDRYIEAMNRHSKVFSDELIMSVAGKETDLYPFIKRLTLDIICETAMGTDLDSQHQPSHPYVDAVMTILHYALRITLEPTLWTKTGRKLLGVEKPYQQALAVAHDFTRKAIERRIEASAANGGVDKGTRVFLDMLISCTGENQMSVEEMREEVDTFMFEGHDTTASGLSWIIWCLACHPNLQERVRDELDEILGADRERDITREDLNKMTYLERFVKETFRLFPPVPMVMRRLQEDLPCGVHTLPRGATVMINPLTIHRNELVYPDAPKFDPDRFLPENSTSRHAYDYIPFSAGPRNCIGQRFAIYEEKVAVSWLLRRFRFSTSIGLHDNAMLAEAVLRPMLGCLVTATPL